MPKTIRVSAILNPVAGTAESITEVRRQEALLKTGVLQNAILNSANFSSIATDPKRVIQIFNVGAERMPGYAAADVLNKITPADISDPQEVIARAKALSAELGTPIAPGFEALVFKASREIEDNPANLKLVEQLIARRSDLRLLSAVNGNSGIEIARVSRPDVILMDINLPGINGFEPLKILREDPVTAHIPVIAISANVMPLDVEMGLKAGFFRYITKPIKVNEFMETLDTALEHAKAQPGRAHQNEQEQ